MGAEAIQRGDRHRDGAWSIALPGCRAKALALILLPLATGCARHEGNPAPPRVDTPAELLQRSSTIEVPISVPLSVLEDGLNRRIPTQLWQIDRPDQTCVPAQRLKIFGRKVKVTPALRCRIVGQVTRGRIRLSGRGAALQLTMPVSAVVSARDVGGIIKRETATGSAIVRALATLSINRNWSPAAKVSIAYDWIEPPGINLLGQRIKFAQKADAKLKTVIAGLERELPKELAKLRARDRLADTWKQAFTSIMLNRERPPVWMRVTPRSLGFAGYRVAGGQLQMRLTAEALTETFVGDRPPDPTPTPLPPPSRLAVPRGLHFFIPVLADYRQLEPVVERALDKLARRGITLKRIGKVDAEFGKVTIYATEGGRLAVGIEAKVRALDSALTVTSGEVWLSAIPDNEADSQVVRVSDLKIATRTDNRAADLLIALFDNDSVRENIRTALTHDFAGDYDKVLVAARKAIGHHRQGDFMLSATASTVRNGTLKATGQGLFLMVEVSGKANIRYQPK